MIGDLRDVRTQLLIVVGVLLLLDVGGDWPCCCLRRAARAARGSRQYEQLRMEKIEKTQGRGPGPGHGPEDCNGPRAGGSSSTSERLAQRYSAMSEQLSHIATRSRGGRLRREVRRARQDESARRRDTTSIGITIQVHGSYAQDMRFINAVERQKMLLLIDAVSFGGMQGDALTVSVHLSTFLRSAA